MGPRQSPGFLNIGLELRLGDRKETATHERKLKTRKLHRRVDAKSNPHWLNIALELRLGDRKETATHERKLKTRKLHRRVDAKSNPHWLFAGTGSAQASAKRSEASSGNPDSSIVPAWGCGRNFGHLTSGTRINRRWFRTLRLTGVGFGHSRLRALASSTGGHAVSLAFRPIGVRQPRRSCPWSESSGIGIDRRWTRVAESNNGTHQWGRANDVQADQETVHPSSTACDGYPHSATAQSINRRSRTAICSPLGISANATLQPQLRHTAGFWTLHPR